MINKQSSKYFFTAFVIIAALLTASFAARFNSASSLHTVDRSYDAVEQARSERHNAGNVVADLSYDQVESLRVNRLIDVAADRSYDQVESLRIDRTTKTADHSYNQVEQLRIERHVDASIADRSYDAIENLRAQRTN